MGQRMIDSTIIIQPLPSERKGREMARALPQGFRRKKNGSIEFRFTIGEDRFSVSGSTVKECREKERKKREAVAAGQYIRNEKITVADYYDEWEKAHSGAVKESTILAERIAFRPILDRIGKEQVSKLERRQIIALQASLQKSFTTGGTNFRMSLLSSVLKSAVLDEIISKNPCAGVKPLKRTEAKARDTIHRALTQEEQDALFTALKDHWHYDLFCFLIQTGCRIGEALALQWSDIDHRRGIIHIRKTMIDTQEGVKISDTTKSRAGMRDIPLNDEIRETLKRQRQKVRDVFGDQVIHLDGKDSCMVFVGMGTGKALRRNSVSAVLGYYAEKAGIDHIGVHALRDTFATRAIEAGMNPQTLKEILGHGSYAMTMDLYAHVMENTKRDEMGKIRVIG